jgi:hypothetical protein
MPASQCLQRAWGPPLEDLIAGSACDRHSTPGRWRRVCADLTDDWEIDQATIESYRHRGWSVITTSAKTGQGVEEAFVTLAQRL